VQSLSAEWFIVFGLFGSECRPTLPSALVSRCGI
jgi:hypothetical protein